MCEYSLAETTTAENQVRLGLRVAIADVAFLDRRITRFHVCVSVNWSVDDMAVVKLNPAVE